MNFELLTLIALGSAYLSLLFGIAYLTERGWIPQRIVRHPSCLRVIARRFCEHLGLLWRRWKRTARRLWVSRKLYRYLFGVYALAFVAAAVTRTHQNLSAKFPR